MKLLIDIPKEFICDFEADKFHDFFSRVLSDINIDTRNNEDEVWVTGNYEMETAEMLQKAFNDAVVVE